MSTVRYGIIGSGMMGQEHIRNIALLEGARVAAVAEPDQGMRAAAAGMLETDCALFDSHRELLSADACDAYVIASPNDTHHAILRDLMEAGKPVLCEKPLCSTAEDCRDLLALDQSRKVPVWVAMEYRYMPPVSRMLEMLGEDATGTPRMMSVREHRFPFLDKVDAWNRFNRRTGGTLVEKCCHFWDLMRLVFRQDPVRVYASGAMDVNHLDEEHDGERADVIDNAYVTVDFEGGQRGMLDLCMFAEGSKWQEIIAVTGPKARVEALIPGPLRFATDRAHLHGRVVFSDRTARVETMEDVEVDERLLHAGDHHGSTYYQHCRFLELVRGEREKPDVTLEDGLWSVLVGEAAEHSIRTGLPVSVKG